MEYDCLKEKRKKWNQEKMVLAVKAVRSGKMGYKKAAKHFKLPKSTIERYTKDQSKSPEDLLSVKLGRKPVFSSELEDELVNYCVNMDARFYGLRRQDITMLASQLAIRNRIKNPFSTKNETAGKKWLASFLKRHPQLSLRVSHARIKSFNPGNVDKFFNLYEPEFSKINGKPHRLFNVVEIGMAVVQCKTEKAITKVVYVRGKKEVAALKSAEKDSLITVVICMNAVGSFVPPLIVWPTDNISIEVMEGAPAGSIWGYNPSGCIETDLFAMWFDHFIKVSKPSQDDPVLLILDGHYSDARNFDAIQKARNNNIEIVCLPPHSSHTMQPLNVGFMKHFKTYYLSEIESWLESNPNHIVTSHEVAKLFGSAYSRAVTIAISGHAFYETGLYPFSKEIFRDYDFAIFRGEDVSKAERVDEIITSQLDPEDVFIYNSSAAGSSNAPVFTS